MAIDVESIWSKKKGILHWQEEATAPMEPLCEYVEYKIRSFNGLVILFNQLRLPPVQNTLSFHWPIRAILKYTQKQAFILMAALFS